MQSGELRLLNIKLFTAESILMFSVNILNVISNELLSDAVVYFF